jgi:hypothetical protein
MSGNEACSAQPGWFYTDVVNDIICGPGTYLYRVHPSVARPELS